jgi:hypothetical protein
LACIGLFPGDATKALVILWDPQAKPGDVQLQIQLMGYAFAGGTQVPSWGNPAISCDLNARQASFVLDHDVPLSLIEAMLETAVRLKWTPMPAGGVVNVVEVDPSSHFPEQ